MAGEILIAGSLGWLIIWSILGMKAGKEHPEWLQDMQSVSKAGDLAQFWTTFDHLKVQTIAHAHANVFACVAFLIGLAMNAGSIGYSPQFRLVMAIWIVVAMVLSGIGDRLRSVPVAGTGGIMFLIALIATFIGVFV